MTTAEPVAATTPAQVSEIWGAAFNRGDIEGMMSLYTADCAFVADPSQVIHGTDGIRAVLEGFLALKGTITFSEATIVEHGDTALCHARWTATGTGPEGPVEMGGYTSEVVQRQADGTWKYVIDDPGIGR